MGREHPASRLPPASGAGRSGVGGGETRPGSDLAVSKRRRARRPRLIDVLRPIVVGDIGAVEGIGARARRRPVLAMANTRGWINDSAVACGHVAATKAEDAVACFAGKALIIGMGARQGGDAKARHAAAMGAKCGAT